MKHDGKVVQQLLKSQVQEKKNTVEFHDIWAVYKHNNKRSKKFTIPKVGLLACLLLLIATPVGANFFMKWNNIELVKEDAPIQPVNEENAIPWLKYEFYSDYLQTYEQATLKESEKIAPFKILRPVNFAMPLEQTTGVLSSTGAFGAYWDIFHDGDKWAYARQELDERSKQMLNEQEMKVQFMLPQSAEVLSLSNQEVIAILDDLGEDGKRITMLVETNSEHIITFEIRGNIGAPELTKLAKSYLEK